MAMHREETGNDHLHEPVAIRGENKRDIPCFCVVEGLLTPIADAVVVILRLDHGDRKIWLVVKDVVSALAFATRDQLAADDNAAFGEADFFSDLKQRIPSRIVYRRRNEVRADFSFV